MRCNGSWWLASHPTLPIIEILASDSSRIGWLLGYPINLNSQLITGSIQIPVPSEDSEAPSQFESLLYTFGGRFIALFLTRKISRIYVDTAASLSTVFCPKQEIVASSTALIPYSEGCENNYGLIHALELSNKDNWYPFGLTPRHWIERLLPNHFLDLVKWEMIRHWPTGEIATTQDIQDSVFEIASVVKNNIAALAKDYLLHMSLTDGRDSRMLLPCAREQLKNITFFTIAIPDAGGILDSEVASQIAKRHKLNHVVLRFEQATKTELDEWLYRTGNCVAGRTWKNVRTLKQLDPQRVVLLGLAGEVGRSSLCWRDSDTESSPISAHKLLERIHLPINTEIEERAKRWLEDLPIKNIFTILELFYIEQRLGCWAGPQQYGHVSSAFRVFPFVHRRIFEIMLSLPSDYKRNQMLATDLIQSQWPELLDFQFNQPTGIKRYFNIIKKKSRSIRKQLMSLMQW